MLNESVIKGKAIDPPDRDYHAPKRTFREGSGGLSEQPAVASGEPTVEQRETRGGGRSGLKDEIRAYLSRKGFVSRDELLQNIALLDDTKEAKKSLADALNLMRRKGELTLGDDGRYAIEPDLEPEPKPEPETKREPESLVASAIDVAVYQAECALHVYVEGLYDAVLNGLLEAIDNLRAVQDRLREDKTKQSP